MLKDFNTLLLYIFMILLLYCLMYKYIYNTKKFSFDDDDIEDKFMNLTYTDELSYLGDLTNITNDINNNLFNNNINNLNKTSIDTINNLSNIYFKDYLQYVNKKNATVFNVYQKLKLQSKI